MFHVKHYLHMTVRLKPAGVLRNGCCNFKNDALLHLPGLVLFEPCGDVTIK